MKRYWRDRTPYRCSSPFCRQRKNKFSGRSTRNHFKTLSKYANFTDITVTTAYCFGSPPSPISHTLATLFSWRFFAPFFGIISGTCRYIRFSFQNQCTASFEASFQNIIAKLRASISAVKIEWERERATDRKWQKRWQEKSRHWVKRKQ